MSVEPTPTYQGRRLPRPHEEVVDQGLSFDVSTLLSRRGILISAGAGGLLALSACSATATPTIGASTGTTGTTGGGSTTTEIPDETAGPYPGDGSNGPNALTESGIIRSDIRTSFDTGSATAAGIPLTIELTILDMTQGNAGFANVAVYVWHANQSGQYSMYSAGVENENYLRGVQVADAAGKVSFTSVVPACYDGRWPHIHFEVYPTQDAISDAANAIATSQIALPEEMCSAVYATSGYEQSVTNMSKISLSSDMVFGDDNAATQLGRVTGDVSTGYTIALTAPIDTSTTPTGGSMGGGPGGTPPSGGMPGR